MATIAGAVAALGYVLPRESAFDGFFDDLTLAAAQRIASTMAAPAPAAVVVIAMDAKTLAAPQFAVLPRPLMSNLFAATIEAALAHGARGVAVDVIFAFDAAVVALDGQRRLLDWDNRLLGVLARHGRSGAVVVARSRTQLPARRFLGAAGSNGTAMAELPLDPDGVVRETRARMLTDEGEPIATLAGALLAAGGVAAPERLPVARLRPADALPTVSMVDVLDCAEPSALRALFDGRLVLIGGVVDGEDRHAAYDRFMTAPAADPATDPPAQACAFPRPRTRDDARSRVAGVFVHATAVDNAVSGGAVVGAERWVAAALGGLGALLGGVAAARLGPTLATACVLGLSAAAFGLAALAALDGVLAPPARFVGGAAIGLFGTWAFASAFVDRAGRRLRQSFERYLSPALVERMLEADRLPSLDGEAREVAVMFADLSGFTAASQALEPDVLTRTLNIYLGIIAETVEQEDGYIDKFVGDAAMALWNAPLDHPAPSLAATRAALRAVEAVMARARLDEAARRPFFLLKVAVAAGSAVVGNVGHERRVNYTAIGRTVNECARLESVPPRLGVSVVLNETAAQHARSAFVVMQLDRMALKGFDAKRGVFTPLGLKDGPDGAMTQALATRFEAAMAAPVAPRAAELEHLARAPWAGAAAARAALTRLSAATR